MSGCRPLSQTEIYNATPPVCPSYSYAFIGFAGLQNVISAAYTEVSKVEKYGVEFVAFV